MHFIVIYFVKKKKSVGSVVAIFLVGGVQISIWFHQ